METVQCTAPERPGMRTRMLLLVLMGLAASPLAHADHTPGVIVIDSLEGLQAMDRQLDGRYVLGQDIDAGDTSRWNGGAGFQPIGRGAPFTGSFDGRGHAIQGLFIHRPNENDVGLFGHALNATLRDVRLVGGQVTGAANVGALVGHNEAVGGDARIDHVCAWVAVNAAGTAGGLVAHNEAYRGVSRIANARAGGAVHATGSKVGGLVGHNEAYEGTASLSEVYASGEVIGRDYAGGSVGYNDAPRGAVPIEGSHASGAVSAAAAVAGGLVGLDTHGSIAHSFYATTDAQGRAINRFADSAGKGVAWEALQRMPEFARWRDLPDRCGQASFP